MDINRIILVHKWIQDQSHKKLTKAMLGYYTSLKCQQVQMEEALMNSIENYSFSFFEMFDRLDFK
jgi:hypothetical protein